MSTPTSLSIGTQLGQIEAFLVGEFRSETPEGAFALHVYAAVGEAGPTLEWGAPPQPDVLRLGQGPSLAVAGYRLACPKATALDLSSWESGLRRLSGRDPFPADRQTFAFRPLEVFGICLGVSKWASRDPKVVHWLQEVTARAGREAEADSWARALYGVAAFLLGGVPLPLGNFRPDRMRPEELALERWLLIAHAPPGSGPGVNPLLAQIDGEILRWALTTSLETSDVARAAVLHHALRRALHERLESELEATWQVGRQTCDAVRLVVSLCRRFPLFARQIQARRQGRPTIALRDEYDVQDAMHALLRLHFEDVRDEEWTPSFAGMSSRVDFMLKRERVVVEVKMTRKNLGQKEVISELTEDKEKYRTHPDCRALVCFVYDPEGRCDNPTALEDDVSVTEGEFRVVVVVAPKGT